MRTAIYYQGFSQTTSYANRKNKYINVVLKRRYFFIVNYVQSKVIGYNLLLIVHN